MPALRRYTVADLVDLPEDGKRYELIRGELVVSPSPSVAHQVVLMRLNDLLGAYLLTFGLQDTRFVVDADISWDDQTLVQPDLLVVHPDDLTASWSTAKRLRLAVEVLSPSSHRRDRVDKRELYQSYGVETYWGIDIESGMIEQWRPDDERPAQLFDQLSWRVTPDAPEMTIDVPALFANLPR